MSFLLWLICILFSWRNYIPVWVRQVKGEGHTWNNDLNDSRSDLKDSRSEVQPVYNRLRFTVATTSLVTWITWHPSPLTTCSCLALWVWKSQTWCSQVSWICWATCPRPPSEGRQRRPLGHQQDNGHRRACPVCGASFIAVRDHKVMSHMKTLHPNYLADLNERR